MAKFTVGLLVGSPRLKNNSGGIASWIHYQLKALHPDYQVKKFTPTTPLNLVSTPINSVSPRNIKDGSYEDAIIRTWSKEVSSCNAIIFVTPVYNHSYTGQLKIMIDHLFHEFFGKPVILIVQGPTSASLGLDHLRALVNKYQMNVVDELSMKIPYEYVSSPKRVASEFDGTYTNDPFLKEWELKLQEAIEKLES